MDDHLPSTPVVKKFKINEITASLSSSRGVPAKRTMPVKRGHSEMSDNSPVPTAKLQRMDFTPTNSSPNDSGKENEETHVDDSSKKSPITEDIFSTCIPHHYHSLQDHEKDEEKAFARVKRLLTAISTAKSKANEPPVKVSTGTIGQSVATSTQVSSLIRPSMSSVPGASLTSLTTTTTVTTTPISSIGQHATSTSLDKSTPTSAADIAASKLPTSSVTSISNSIAPVSSGSSETFFTFGQSTDSKPTFNFSATIPSSLVSQPSTAQTNVVSFNSSTPASTLNHLSTLAGNMVGSAGTYFSVGSAPSSTRKTGARSSRRRR